MDPWLAIVISNVDSFREEGMQLERPLEKREAKLATRKTYACSVLSDVDKRACNQNVLQRRGKQLATRKTYACSVLSDVDSFREEGMQLERSLEKREAKLATRKTYDVVCLVMWTPSEKRSCIFREEGMQLATRKIVMQHICIQCAKSSNSILDFCLGNCHALIAVPFSLKESKPLTQSLVEYSLCSQQLMGLCFPLDFTG